MTSAGSARAGASLNERPPNILVIMVDEQRAPMPYESADLAAFRDTYLTAQKGLAQGGTSFGRHYAASMACAPGRACLYTGHYPSLHGVSQTDGAAKAAYDPDMHWLHPRTVPTIGHYFRAAGYRTFWRGKWHVSDENLTVPGTHTPVDTFDADGNRLPEAERYYQSANPLGPFGFDGWIGPEPHGADPLNSGASAGGGRRGRDAGFAEQIIELLDGLDGDGAAAPWFVMASFVNPHDIALWGFFARLGAAAGTYDFTVGDHVPGDLFDAAFADSADETLEGRKPSVQESYRTSYRKFMQPSIVTDDYFRLYYQLHEDVDGEIARVLARLDASPQRDDTIVVFTSDHGDLLGSHGGLFQKWYTMYEEALRVPLVVRSEGRVPAGRTLSLPTSHVDILPTLLGLAGLDAESLRATLAPDFTDAQPLVGRDLSPLIFGTATEESLAGPIYYMSDDDPSKGLDQANIIGIDYASVIEPGSVEAVVAEVDGRLWKYGRYFENPQDWTSPGQPVADGVRNVIDRNMERETDRAGTRDVTYRRTTTVAPAPDEYEMYDLTNDPLELENLAGTGHPMEERLRTLLREQCMAKRLTPSLGTVPGQPACPAAEVTAPARRGVRR
ncbi:sulfatase-like hydrolase/transferase [Azospirillum halopraeferens]|uniref:sulfatase-like hydrolase/transferase n=1 Tax=Azospirillum halopraeferens TaxID=34010 RepID=UPI001B3B96C7|nr:sulfatase-like hydrolase/transferase [Azospirillum halopraeferens]